MLVKHILNLLKPKRKDAVYHEGSSRKDVLMKFKRGNYIESKYELRVLERYFSTFSRKS